MNLGMALRQDQLRGWASQSGDEVLANYIAANGITFDKIIKQEKK